MVRSHESQFSRFETNALFAVVIAMVSGCGSVANKSTDAAVDGSADAVSDATKGSGGAPSVDAASGGSGGLVGSGGRDGSGTGGGGVTGSAGAAQGGRAGSSSTGGAGGVASSTGGLSGGGAGSGGGGARGGAGGTVVGNTGGSAGGKGGTAGGAGTAGAGTGGAGTGGAGVAGMGGGGMGGAAVVRCDQPASQAACDGQIPRSCQDLYSWGVRTDAAYRIDPDGAGTNAPFVAYCEMNTRDQMGWTLVGKVNTANVDSVEETRPWFVTETNAAAMATRTFVSNQPPASHGAFKFVSLLTPSTAARFELYAQLDVTQKATWYKEVASPASFQGWFTSNDTTASKVCTDLAFSLNCATGTIAPQALTGAPNATVLGGMTLTPFGYTAGGPLHMRLNDDLLPAASGVCSYTGDNDANKWKDSYMTHWGNGLLIWIN